MRIAYLIMTHNRPDQLLRLVNALDCKGAGFYIHIDGKTDVAPFQAILKNRENVHFVSNRVNANWMGFSLVEISLRMLELAVAHGFDYCVQLSGADYPIKSNDYLFSFFEKADKEYVTFWRLEDRPHWEHKVQYYYLTDTIPIRDWSHNREKVYWRRLFWGRFFKYQQYMPKRRFPKNVTPYGGSGWFSLSYDCAAYVLKFVKENPGFKRFYKYTHSPDEMFFQTIILNSVWAARVENYDNYEKWSAARRQGSTAAMLPEPAFNFRYIDWSGGATGERETPAVLDERDWEKIKESDCHFARKFDPQRSAKLLDRIDQEILGVTNLYATGQKASAGYVLAS
jgi:hypothetical protein